MQTYIIISSLVGLAAGFGLSLILNRTKGEKAQEQADRIIRDAKRKAEEIEAQLTDESIALRSKMVRIHEEQEKSLSGIKKRISIREETLKKREEKAQERIDQLEACQKRIAKIQDEKQELSVKAESELLAKTGLNLDDIKSKIKKDLTKESDEFFKTLVVKKEQFTKDNAIKKGCNILKSIMQKYVGPSSVVPLDRTVEIKQDVVKARVLGKKGANILYFEEKTEVSVIVDDQPGFFTVSCFNLVKQEIARRALEKLTKKKEIDEKVIDEAIESATQETNSHLEKVGIEAAEIIGIEKRDPELMQMIGRLKYRTSYGQNILYHSMEIAFFSAMMAAEIGADIHTAKLGGFYHDLGKAIDQEVGGSHDHLSKEILEKFDYSWEIVHAAWTHHDAIPIETVEAQIVKAADAISSGRPGARSESSEQYYERIQALETMAKDTDGVKKAYAVSAGREIRTFMDENKIKDEDMQAIADKLASQIEESLAYPGTIKVNLIRTLNAVDIANKNQKSQ